MKDLLFRALLFLYPGETGRRFGAEMLEMMRYRHRHQRPLRFWSQLVRDTLRAVPVAYLAVWRERTGRAPVPPEPSARVDVPGQSRDRGGFVEGVFRDFRLAVRSLVRRPGFTVAVILCLGVGLGANTAVFSFLYGIILRPLPFEEADRLTVLYERKPGLSTRASPIYSNVVTWRDETRAFTGIGAYSRTTKAITGPEGPELLLGSYASHDLFDVLRVQPSLGREFNEADDVPGAPAAVILSHGLWQQRFGGTHDVIGRTLILDEEPHTVIGWSPPQWEGWPPESRSRGPRRRWTGSRAASRRPIPR
jgi:hypothetical protein